MDKIITRQSDTEIKVSGSVQNETIWSKDALLAEKGSLQQKMDKVDNLLAECDKNGVLSSSEIAANIEATRVAKLTPEELAAEEAARLTPPI